MVVDFGFAGLETKDWQPWFALLKDFYDALVALYASEEAANKLHKYVVRGSLVPEMRAMAKNYTLANWPRFYAETTEPILVKAHSATSIYR